MMQRQCFVLPILIAGMLAGCTSAPAQSLNAWWINATYCPPPPKPWGLSWSPDGSALAFRYADGNSSHHVVADIQRESLTTIGSSSSDSIAIWSPDGSMLAYSDEAGYVIAKRDGTVINTIGPDFTELGWSPDSTQLVVESKGMLYSMRLDGTNQTELLTDAVMIATDIAWSPDGEWITYLATTQDFNHALHVISVDDQQSFQIDTYATKLLWSPDSRWIALSTDGSSESVIELLNFESKVLATLDAAASAFAEPIWMPDSSALIYANSDGELLRKKLDGTSMSISLPDIDVLEAAISPDGNQLAYISGDGSYDPAPDVYIEGLTDGSLVVFRTPEPKICFNP